MSVCEKWPGNLLLEFLFVGDPEIFRYNDRYNELVVETQLDFGRFFLVVWRNIPGTTPCAELGLSFCVDWENRDGTKQVVSS